MIFVFGFLLKPHVSHLLLVVSLTSYAKVFFISRDSSLGLLSIFRVSHLVAFGSASLESAICLEMDKML